MRVSIHYAVAGILLAFAPGRAAACDYCNAVLLGGVFNKARVKDNSEYRQALLDFLLTSRYEEVKNAMNAGLDLKVPIEGVPLGLGADFGQESFKKWQMDHKHLKSSDTFNKRNYELMLKWASKDILDAWTKCMSACHESKDKLMQGLNIRVVSVQDETFTIAFSWIPSPGDDGKPQITDSVVSGCTVVNEKQLAEKLVIATGIDSHSVVFKRQADADSVVVVNTTKGSVTVIVRGKPIACPDCKGTGVFRAHAEIEVIPGSRASGSFVGECPKCKGKGTIKP